MPESKKILLRFEVSREEKISSSEFIALFRCIDDLTRTLAEVETQNFFDALQISSDRRLRLLQDLRAFSRKGPSPAEVVTIERGSWTVETLIHAAPIIWLAKKFVDTTLLVAWNESRAREVVQTFFRERIFLGAARVIEQRAAEKPKYGNLRIIRVAEAQDSTRDEPKLVVVLQPVAIIEARKYDNEAIQAFIGRMLEQ